MIVGDQAEAARRGAPPGFCPRDEDCSAYGMKWYASVVKTEIIPTLEEYWFDTPEKVQKASRILTD